MIKISKKIQWLLPYIESVEDIANVKRIKRIRAFRVKPNCDEWTDAQIITKDNNKVVITIKTHTQTFHTNSMYRSFKSYTRLSYAQILDSVAHEIAHLKYWQHDIKHFRYQLRILRRFIKVMEKQGIKDTWKKIPKG